MNLRLFAVKIVLLTKKKHTPSSLNLIVCVNPVSFEPICLCKISSFINFTYIFVILSYSKNHSARWIKLISINEIIIPWQHLVGIYKKWGYSGIWQLRRFFLLSFPTRCMYFTNSKMNFHSIKFTFLHMTGGMFLFISLSL